MGELVPGLVVEGGDRRLRPIGPCPRAHRVPRRPTGRQFPAYLSDRGISHVGLVCDDIAATRSELEHKGVRFLTRGLAGIAGLKTTWFEDPYGTVFILMEKGDDSRPYWRQPPGQALSGGHGPGH